MEIRKRCSHFFAESQLNTAYILAYMICNVLVTFLKLLLHFSVLIFHVQADGI